MARTRFLRAVRGETIFERLVTPVVGGLIVIAVIRGAEFCLYHSSNLFI